MKKYFFLIYLVYLSNISADSVTLFNDSPFDIVAIVQSANGKVLGQENLHPGEQSVWSTDYDVTNLDIDYTSSGSYTPYTVIWRCSYEGFYSVCTNVASGASVTANSCQGPKYCKPKPKKKKGEQNDQETSCYNCSKGSNLK
ncbi:MAG: hypothetical protein K1060chlam5_00788 [Candidatus Anoxychlamydiales bacterium]|nr:hypothetical protein [Candidatus Anoxychlamydiales bacterium]